MDCFGKETQVATDGAICTLSVTLYLVDGILGDNHQSKVKARFYLDTGEGFNIIRCSALRINRSLRLML